MTEICLIRHGNYVYERVNGGGPKLDLGLSDQGRLEVEALRQRLVSSKEIAPLVLLSSTERRALETARLLSPAFGQPVTEDRDLEEWRSEDGSIETEDFMAQWNGLSERQKPFHRFVAGCETGIEFSTRVHSALHRIVTEHAGQRVVLITHGGFIQVAFQYFFGFGEAAFRRAYPAAGNTAITRWRLDQKAERWVLEASNDMHHLRSGVV